MTTTITAAFQVHELVTFMANFDQPVPVGVIANHPRCPIPLPWPTARPGGEAHRNVIRRRLDRAHRAGWITRTRSGPGAGGPWLWSIAQ